MNGYGEAAKLDGLIDELVKKHPPTKENARAWLVFTRTVTTSLHIMELEARKALEIKEVE